MIVFFPTYARRLSDGGSWRVSVAGMVFRPLPERSRRRSLAVGVLRRLLDLDEEEAGSELFRRRSDAFLFQRVAGRRVRVSLGGRRVDAGLSDRLGHFEAQVDLPADEIEALAPGGPAGERRLSYAATADTWDDDLPGGGAPAVGSIDLVEAEGTSVISDIDDTVKITNVGDRRELLRNTFVREFAAVPGMPEVYRDWQLRGAAFHYVSSSPWQLSRCLDAFLAEAGLPAGSLHLRVFRLKDSTPLGRLPSRKRLKRRAIERIMDDFPRRRFVLVGDSGERDPEVYAAVARRRPRQVAGVLIREVAGHGPLRKLRDRLDRLARRLPSGLLQSFIEPAEIAAVSAPPSDPATG